MYRFSLEVPKPNYNFYLIYVNLKEQSKLFNS